MHSTYHAKPIDPSTEYCAIAQGIVAKQQHKPIFPISQQMISSFSILDDILPIMKQALHLKD